MVFLLPDQLLIDEFGMEWEPTNNPLPAVLLCHLQNARYENEIVEPVVIGMESLGAARLRMNYSTYTIDLINHPKKRGYKILLIFLQRSHSSLSLKDYARNTIRNSLTAVRFRRKLAALPLPQIMRDFLRCEEAVNTSAYLPLL